jgi:hypothetical protein
MRRFVVGMGLASLLTGGCSFVVSGPRITAFEEPAGTTHEMLVCPGAWDVFATVNGRRAQFASMSPRPSPACTTTVT